MELKRYSVAPKLTKIEGQGRKYLAALRSVLEQQNVKDPRIEVVFVLGSKPKVDDLGIFQTDDEAIDHALDAIAGRYALYDELIGSACSQYEEYFEASKKALELNELLNSLL